MNKLLIGHTGLVGGVLQQYMQFDTFARSIDIEKIIDGEFNLTVCTAPHSNRILAKENPEQDTQSVDRLIGCLSKTKIEKFVLISTCDTIISPDSVYGHNRLKLEKFVSDKFSDHCIIRLPSLIHDKLKKNILYDLCHETFLDKINPHQYSQWYPLSMLPQHIHQATMQEHKELNLCSEPIGNWEIIDRFFNNHKHKINYNQPPGNIYNIQPYDHTREQIFYHMQEYYEQCKQT